MRTGPKTAIVFLALFLVYSASIAQVRIYPNAAVETKFNTLYPNATDVSWVSDVWHGQFADKVDFLFQDRELVVLFNYAGDTLGSPVIIRQGVNLPPQTMYVSQYVIPSRVKQKLALLFPDTLHVLWEADDGYHFKADFSLGYLYQKNRDRTRIDVSFHDTLVTLISEYLPDSTLIPKQIENYLKSNYKYFVVSGLEQSADSGMHYKLAVHKANKQEIFNWGKYYEMWFTSDGQFIRKKYIHIKIVRRTEFCFIAGTQITMYDGTTKPIEQIKIGDRILDYNYKNRSIEVDTVKNIVSPVHDQLVIIKFSDSTTITSTIDHPYMVNNKGYSSLSVGDTCLKYDGTKLKEVIVVKMISKNKKVKTYNLFVLHNSNYFANGIVVSDESGKIYP